MDRGSYCRVLSKIRGSYRRVLAHVLLVIFISKASSKDHHVIRHGRGSVKKKSVGDSRFFQDHDPRSQCPFFLKKRWQPQQ
jgi:hypothetical protein